jgi:hypothetical protein
MQFLSLARWCPVVEIMIVYIAGDAPCVLIGL